MFGDFGNDHSDFLFETERVSEARHPPIQTRSIHRPRLRQRHLDARTGCTYARELVDPNGNLGLNSLRAALFFDHALLLISDAVCHHELG